MNLFHLGLGVGSADVSLNRKEFTHRLERIAPGRSKLFPCVAGPYQGRYQQRSPGSDQNSCARLRPILPDLRRIGDSVGYDGDRRDTTKKIGVWNLAGPGIARIYILRRLRQRKGRSRR